jgi:hypothetical protein
MGPIRRLAPIGTGLQTISRNIIWNWTCIIALQITDPSSRQRWCPTWKNKKVIVTQINVTSGHRLQKGHDTKMNWPTERWSQYNLNLVDADSGWQSIDPTSRQRGHPTTTQQQWSSVTNIWPWEPEWARRRDITDWLTISCNVTLNFLLWWKWSAKRQVEVKYTSEK